MIPEDVMVPAGVGCKPRASGDDPDAVRLKDREGG